MNYKITNKNTGAVSIILSIVLLNVLFIIGMGISVLMTQQLRASSHAGDSVVAIYASESGVERCLYHIFCVQDEIPNDQCISEVGSGLNQGCATPGGGSVSGTLNVELQSTYTTDYNGTDRITSIGEYRGTTRALQLSF
ncbi:hypothetical protein ACFLZC_02180 [Patescibacteria group bacterium]